MKLSRFILSALLLLSIIPAVIVVIVCSVSFKNETHDIIKNSVSVSSHLEAESIEKYLLLNKEELAIAASQPVVSRALEFYNSNQTDQNLEQYPDIAHEMFTTHLAMSNVKYYSIVGVNGLNVVSSNPERVGKESTFEKSHRTRLMKGETVTSGLMYDSDGQPCFMIAHPVEIDGEYAGSIIFIQDTSFIDGMVNSQAGSDVHFVTVIDADGNIISTNSTLFKTGQNVSSYRSEVTADADGCLFFRRSQSGLSRIGYMSVVPGSGWTVSSSVDESLLYGSSSQTITIVIVIAVSVLSLLAAVYIFLTRNLARPLSNLIAAMKKIQNGEYAVRLPEKEYGELSVVVKAFNSLMDKIAADNKELSLKEERYRIVSDMSEDVIFEFYPSSGRIYYTPSFEKVFGRTAITEGLPQSVLENGDIYPDDGEDFLRFFNKVTASAEQMQQEVRIKKGDGSYIWCSIIAKSIFESETNVRVIGKIVDISEGKKERDSLISKAQTDLLTALYNKTTTENLVSEALKAGRGSHALFIIDIDNFKNLNDTFGHLFGDSVLREFGRRIKGCFRTSDIVGRIGGDEFLVFMKDTANAGLVRKKAEEVIAMFHSPHKIDGTDYKISGSMGIAFYPGDAGSFKRLFECADKALYSAKSKGKDQFEFYDSTMKAQHFFVKAESGDEPLNGEDFISSIFTALYEAQDARGAVTEVLAAVGTQFNVSRAYIFENSQDCLTVSNTYEWCNEGVRSEMSNLQNIRWEDVPGYLDNFVDDIFYCSDIKQLCPDTAQLLRSQGVSSVLQCAIRSNGRLFGFMGFDENNENRLWTKEEIRTLTFVSRILCTFLIKYRDNERLERIDQLARRILDTQDMWTYAVEESTHKLIFVNKKTADFIPEAKVGKTCYEVFFHREGPCERCPIAVLGKNKSTTLEIYNDVYDLWTKATASKMDWEGRSGVCLVCCVDVTEYKKSAGNGQEKGTP